MEISELLLKDVFMKKVIYENEEYYITDIILNRGLAVLENMSNYRNKKVIPINEKIELVKDHL